ncbi:MAG: hypothetical protein IPN76_15880 [Saprospiraceae bacterium]|nr:hypothetical protein [Saprospiraceae bacterium]
MNRELEISQILVYFDLPELFVAKDEIGSRYMALLVEEIENEPHYILTPISVNRLSMYLNGKIDLRDIFTQPEIREFYSILNIKSDRFQVSNFNSDRLPEEFLPEQGLYYESNESLEEELIIKEVTETENTIVHLSLSDSHNRNKIPAEILGDFLKIFQSLVKYTFKKVISQYKYSMKKELDQSYNYALWAFDSSPGSFKIHLSSTAQKDIFGNTKIELALNMLDTIIEDFKSEDEYINTLQKIKGHSIGSYRKLVEKIIQDDVELKYQWFSPGEEKVHFKKIGKDFAKRVIEVLNSKEELGVETKELIGIVKQVDIDRGTWRMLNQEDNKEYSGMTKNKRLLEGIVVDKEIYKFICEEIVEEEKVTEKEKTTYELQKMSKIN